MDTPVYSATSAREKQTNAPWGTLQWLANKEIGNTDGFTLGRVVIKNGDANPRHMHSNCDEALYVLSGKLKHSLGEKDYLLEPGDTLIAPAGVYHNAISVGDCDADMIVVYSSAERDFVKE
jgi:quercetin dioxygenase-like cupin family protein